MSGSVDAPPPGWIDRTPRLALLAGLAVVAVLAGISAQHLPAPSDPTKTSLAYLLALVFGCLVGATELSARYRDRPLAALVSWPAALYMAVNAVAALVMVWLLFTRRLTLGVSVFAGEHRLLDALVIGSFGAMALFRSAIFTIRVRDTTVAVGPAAVLQEILRVADREIDRLRAGPRARGVKQIMRGVTFLRARDTLPGHCLGLMQNVDPAERESLDQAILGIASRRVSDEAKAYSLGLLLMNLVGEDVLSQAVAGLSDRIRGPAPDEPPVLGKVADLDDAALPALLQLCAALAPEIAEEVTQRRQAGRRGPDGRFQLTDLIAPPDDPRITGRGALLVALARIRHAFGQEVVAEALSLLQGGAGDDKLPPGAKEVPTPLSPDDLRPPQAGR